MLTCTDNTFYFPSTGINLRWIDSSNMKWPVHYPYVLITNAKTGQLNWNLFCQFSKHVSFFILIEIKKKRTDNWLSEKNKEGQRWRPSSFWRHFFYLIIYAVINCRFLYDWDCNQLTLRLVYKNLILADIKQQDSGRTPDALIFFIAVF